MNQAEMTIMLTEMEMQTRKLEGNGVRSADRDLFVDSIDDADESSDDMNKHEDSSSDENEYCKSESQKEFSAHREKMYKIITCFARLEAHRDLFDVTFNTNYHQDLVAVSSEVWDRMSRKSSWSETSIISYEQARMMREWQVDYRKILVNSNNIIPRVEEFIKLTSDEHHPCHNEGRYLKHFIDNKLSRQLSDGNPKHFEKYYTEEMSLFKQDMKFDHRRYRPFCCEYKCNGAKYFFNICQCVKAEVNFENKVFCLNKTNCADQVDMGMARILDFISDELDQFDHKASEQTENLERVTNSLKKCEEYGFAVKRFVLWMIEMKRKVSVIDELMDLVTQNSDDDENSDTEHSDTEHGDENFIFDSPFMVFVLKLYYKVKFQGTSNPSLSGFHGRDKDVPLDMSPNLFILSKVPCYVPKPGDARHEFWFKKLYPELTDHYGPTIFKKLAQKHVYQHQIRRDTLTPRLILNLFHADVRLERAKNSIFGRGGSKPVQWMSGRHYLCDPTGAYEMYAMTDEDDNLLSPDELSQYDEGENKENKTETKQFKPDISPRTVVEKSKSKKPAAEKINQKSTLPPVNFKAMFRNL